MAGSVSPSVHQACIMKAWQLQRKRGVHTFTGQLTCATSVRQIGAMLSVPLHQAVSYTNAVSSSYLTHAIYEDSKLLAECSRELRGNIEYVMALCSRNGSALQHASPKLQSNRNLVMTAVQQDASALQHASKNLQRDSVFVKEVVQLNPRALKYVCQLDLVESRQLLLDAMSADWRVLEHASHAMQSDMEVVMVALELNGNALQYAAELLRDHPQAVWAAVRNDGSALRYASEQQQAGREVVMAAVRQNRSAFQYAAE